MALLQAARMNFACARTHVAAAALPFVFLIPLVSLAELPGVDVPAGYTPLKYLESQGNEFVDTGFTPSLNTKVFAEYSLTQIPVTNVSYYVFGCYSSAGKGGRCQFAPKCLNDYHPDGAFLGFGDKDLDKGYVSEFETLDNAVNVHQTVVVDRGTFTMSASTTTKTFTATTPPVFNRPLYLFACNGDTTNFGRAVRLYRVTIWDDDVLKLDLVPAKENASGKVGFVDIAAATPKLYENGNAGGSLKYEEGAPSLLVDAATVSELGGATGGDQILMIPGEGGTVDFAHIYRTVTTSAALTFDSIDKVTPDSLQYLVVGGGGAGGRDCGGGGGAGGLIYRKEQPVVAGAYAITVGGGGAAESQASNKTGQNGSSSILKIGGATIEALGGGGGGAYQNVGGVAGGSGGGGNGTGAGGAATQEAPGLGYGGGAGNTQGRGGGGGGAGGVGGAATSTAPGEGGAAFACDICGETGFYAGGGAGGGSGASARAFGGNGVGGMGGFLTGSGKPATSGYPGANATGSGGGGTGGGNSNARQCGKGGSGVVVVRYSVQTTKPMVNSRGAARAEWMPGGEEYILVFTNTNPSVVQSFTLPGKGMARILVVGGGGAGGTASKARTYGAGGGGGGGGFIEVPSQIYDAGTYTVIVGAGGPAATSQTTAVGANGSDSTVTGPTNIVAMGGGGGGSESAGGSGGNGGGGSKGSTAFGGGSGSIGGYAGGSGAHNNVGAGGAGAGTIGQDTQSTSLGGNGGDGVVSDITGEEVYYAGGGGGGRRTTGSTGNGVGGVGGGGAGGLRAVASEAGVDGRGGGGGGGGYFSPGGKGGDGIVIVRFSAVLDGPIERPTAEEIPYDGTEHVKFTKCDFAYTIDPVSTIKATDAGTYRIKVTLNAGFTWADGSSDPVDVSWSIVQAENVIHSLTLANWKEGSPNDPVLTADFGAETAVYTYEGLTKDGETYGPTTDRPTIAGSYTVSAEIPPTANYVGASAGPVAFTIITGETSPIPELGRFVEISASNYTGTATLPDFPMLIKVSETLIPGFKYGQAAMDGSDIRFSTPEGALLDFEIDEWNPGGTSLIWVRVPEFTKDTTVVMCWGRVAGQEPQTVDAKGTWKAYAGVWHMSEEIDATAAKNGAKSKDSLGKFDGKPYKGAAGKLEQMVSTAGKVGNARVNNSGSYQSDANRLETGAYAVNGTFTYSGWFKMSVASGYPRLGGNKTGNDANGWSIESDNNSATCFRPRGNGSSISPVNVLTVPSLLNTWVYLTFVFEGSTVTVYANGGSPKSDASLTAVTGSGTMTIGGPGKFAEGTFVGAYDEVRFTTQALTPDWILADYRQMANDDTWSSGVPGKTKDVVLANRWVTEPKIEPSVWDVGASPTIFEKGKDSAGATPTVIYRDLQTGGVVTNTMPTVAGKYEATFVIAATDMYEGLQATLSFEIQSNRWVQEPTITRMWKEGGAPEIFRGEDVRGLIDDARGETAYIVYRDCSADTYVTNTVPTAPGSYTAIFVVEAVTVGGIDYGRLEKSVDFNITTESPYSDTDGAQGANGRVLLMNRDANTAGAVDRQGYSDTSTTQATFWQKVNTEAVSSLNLQAGTEFILWTKSYGAKLWHLINCRHGNSFPTSNTADLSQSQVYLPWSGTSYSFKGRTLKAVRNTVGQCVMRNTLNASVYSSCFTNGIGTIYFDAANAWTATGPNAGVYQIAVEIATNCLNTAGRPVDLEPTDENVRQVIGAHWEINKDDPANVTSNWVEAVTNEYGFANWQPVKLEVLKRDYASSWEGEKPFQKLVYDETTATNEFQTCGKAATNICLSIANGGTIENFYRIYIPLNYHGAIRFRIVRQSYDSANFSIDEGGFVLLDNIIASYPQMRADLSAYGIFDEEKISKQVLGQEATWSVPFPAAGADDVMARAKVNYYTNAGKSDANTNDFIVAAKLYYRWRYLNQQVGEWKSVFLDKTDGLKAHLPLELPEVPGDVEYYFETQLNAPFYQYVDYSGTGLDLGGFYTEALPLVTNRRSAEGAPALPSCGTDWFVRLREGESDVEQAKLIVRRGSASAAGTEQIIPMELVDNHVWRGYLQTKTNDTSGAYYRVNFLNRQTPGAEAWETNSVVLYTTTTNNGGIVNGVLNAVGSDADWSFTEVDAATGYLMFQVDDMTRAVTIVHADYQNFNTWSDAKKSIFVGTSVEDETKSGTSQNKRDFEESFSDWGAMSATNSHWTVPSFTDLKNLLGRTAYKSFASDTDNNWEIGQGMWVGKYYADQTDNAKNKGVALQMEGQGKGYVQFTDKDDCPRGIESISFNARLGQSVKFTDFAYYDAATKTDMKNYTFVTRSAFDLNENKNFSGNASLSLVAHYRPGKGCYEARWEQLEADWDTSKGTVKGPNLKKQRLCLYRWSVEGDGSLRSQLLTAVTNNSFKIPAAKDVSISDRFMPFFITVSNTSNNATWIMAGVKGEGEGNNDDVTKRGMKLDPLLNGAGYSADKKWIGVCYHDTKSGLTSGTYGCVSANCEGFFGTPVYYSKAIPFAKFGSDAPSTMVASDTGGSASRFNDKTLQIPFPSDDFATACYSDIASDGWVVTPGRMRSDLDYSSSYLKNLRAAPATQKIKVFTAPAGKSSWTKLAEATVDSFGQAGSTGNYKFDLWTTTDCSVRIAVDDEKTIDDARVDIVVDTVKLTQWRGNDYLDADEMAKLIPGYPADPTDYKGHTNFTFTSCWIVNETTGSGASAKTEGDILMSAKRTAVGTPCSIRSPLMDGTYGRGKGLGMFSFSYKNAQANMKLLLQIATNVSYTTVGSVDILDDNLWTTVTNFTFSGVQVNSPVERVCTCYIGLHDVQGVMRLVVDPALVTNVATKKNPAEFGEITITKVLCRDEPALDSGSWWGWNIRTLGPDIKGEDKDKMMYLPDYSTEPSVLGLSIAANNSIEKDIDKQDAATYRENKPFIQTPTFTQDVVGEVAFRARKYDTLSSQPAAIMLYGSHSGEDRGTWDVLNDGKPFVISNSTYTLYKYKTDPGKSYKAFRLCVNGVPGVLNGGHTEPDSYDNPVRVLIDEVVVSEAVRARVAFRNVGAFRSQLRDRNTVPNVPSIAEQPLCNEGWGVQCEVYAAQLADDINFDIEPMVYLHWYEGTEPWGFENWGSLSEQAGHKVARLPPAMDTNLIFRSTYLGNYADSVVPMSVTPGTTIQYMLEVRYWQKGSAVAMTNYLSAADWVRPSWYRPLDYNRDLGHGLSFAAYNILDTVAPGWAWINEANIYGEFDSYWNNSESDCQFVEVAVPQEADIKGWRINMINNYYGTLVTNQIAYFGTTQLPGMKKDGGLYSADNMVFRVVGNPGAAVSEGGRLDPNLGQLDSTWKFSYVNDVFLPNNELFATDFVGLQLVRASGIIEHEVVVVGNNWYGANYPEDDEYKPSYVVSEFKRLLPGSQYFFAGEDNHAPGQSIGVFTSRGEDATKWNNTMTMTPGRINQNQSIDPDHPTPNGETIIVYANLDNTFGHIVQTVGDLVETNAAAMVFVTRGSARGTNITYRVDPWYELGAVTATEKNKPAPSTFGPVAGQARTYVATVGVGASNNVTVVARAKLADKLVNEFGLDENNRYTPAVIDWLEKGCRLGDRGPWEHPEDGNIYLADFVGLSGNVVTNMTLTQMYWLDMDPTVSNQALVAGMAVPPLPVVRPVEGYMGTTALTNLKMGVFMMITNRCEDATDTLHYGKAWTPYALRGLAPGENSLDFDNSSWGWTSVTFKVTGILANGLTGEQYADDWVPMRWFVFHEDSFMPLDSAVDPGISRIEVKDPYSKESPGYAAGWYRWVETHGYAPVFFSWALDERITPISAEILEQQNYYDTP